MDIAELQGRIARFISGEDISLESANEIELALDDAYPSDDQMQKTVEMLAMYRPNGGDFLFDIPALQKRLSETLDYMQN